MGLQAPPAGPAHGSWLGRQLPHLTTTTPGERQHAAAGLALLDDKHRLSRFKRQIPTPRPIPTPPLPSLSLSTQARGPMFNTRFAFSSCSQCWLTASPGPRTSPHRMWHMCSGCTCSSEGTREVGTFLVLFAPPTTLLGFPRNHTNEFQARDSGLPQQGELLVPNHATISSAGTSPPALPPTQGQTDAQRSAGRCPNVPVALTKAVQAQLVCDLRSVHGIGQVLLVGKHQQDCIAQLILEEH